MDGLTTTCSTGGCFLLLPPPSTSTRTKQTNTFSFPFSSSRRRSSFSASSSRDGPELDQWDQMELKFGKLIGEDPKLTLAKVMARKSNPNASFFEIEKSFYKKKKKTKGKSADDDEVVEVPLDWDIPERNRQKQQQQQQQQQQLSSSMELQGRGKKNALDLKLNLTRPVDKRGVKDAEVVEKPVVSTAPRLQVSAKPAGPGVALRKPDGLVEDEIEEKPSRFRIKPNLLLKMRKGGNRSEDLSEVNLLRKPEIVKISVGDASEKTVFSGDTAGLGSYKALDGSGGDGVLEMGDEEANTVNEMTGSRGSAVSMENVVEPAVTESSTLHDGIDQGVELSEEEAINSDLLDLNSIQNQENTSKSANLQGKPQRLDSLSKEISDPLKENAATPNDAVQKDAVEEFLISAEQEEHEDDDWRKAEHLLQTGERMDVELISGSSRGFVVSFGSLIGFLPYRNLGAKWKFLAFESWLRKKGLDPFLYRQNLSIVGNYAVQNKDLPPQSYESQDQEMKDEEKLGPEMKFEDLLKIYDQEKTKFFSSFVGQRTRVAVAMVDRKSRRLMFSGRPKEKEEVIEKKRSLMAKLSVGDIVQCCIKKITYFGIFVEIEGAPALIHQSEVSWDAALDPTSYFKIGQMVDAKVHQLDYALERITLSLKEITPDPLNEALESVVGASVEASQGDVEWVDVESLIRELEQIDGVIDVSKGRFSFSPGLAPTFQVYMASMYENRYKLLARFENKVQEVIVQASLDKDQMKAAILTCTNRVE